MTARKLQYITPPEGGWKPQHWYVVNVSFGPSNPIHSAIFYSGFLSGGKPAGYNELFGNYDEKLTIGQTYYLVVLQDLGPLLEEEHPDHFKLPREVIEELQ